MSRDPQFADRLRAGCNERGLGCAAAAAFLTDATRSDERRRLLERGCDRGEGGACVELARSTADLAARTRSLHLGCSRREAGACDALRQLLSADVPARKRLLERACKLEAGRGCVQLAELHLDLEHGYDPDPTGKGSIQHLPYALDNAVREAVFYYRKGALYLQLDCMAFDAGACLDLARLRAVFDHLPTRSYRYEALRQAGIDSDEAQARALRARACTLGDTRACSADLNHSDQEDF